MIFELQKNYIGNYKIFYIKKNNKNILKLVEFR